MPSKHPNKSAFWDRISYRYAKSKIRDMASYEHKLQLIKGLLTTDMSVLEVGCGTGMTACILAPFAKQVVAIDISPAMIAIAEKRAQDAEIHTVSFQVGAAESPPVDDESQDVVIAMSLLHLLDDPPGGLRVLRKKLKPGGLFFSSTMCLGDGMSYLKPVLPLMRLVGFAPAVVHFLKNDELVGMISSAGFAVEQVWQPAKNKAAFIVARKT